MSKERPILFNTEMVQAILDGRKTQTRRPVKPQPERTKFGWFCPSKKDTKAYSRLEGDELNCEMIRYSPFGQPGDVLWVRETCCQYDDDHIINGIKYAYKADCNQENDNIRKEYGYKWTPSIRMPKEACRIWLEVKRVWVERVRDISEADAKAEGCGQYHPDIPALDPSYRTYFQELWISIYGEESWNRNEWVWCCEFEVIER